MFPKNQENAGVLDGIYADLLRVWATFRFLHLTGGIQLLHGQMSLYTRMYGRKVCVSMTLPIGTKMGTTGIYPATTELCSGATVHQHNYKIAKEMSINHNPTKS